jgi:hypothetical protein
MDTVIDLQEMKDRVDRDDFFGFETKEVLDLISALQFLKEELEAFTDVYDSKQRWASHLYKENKRLCKALTDAYVGWACGLDVVTGMSNAAELLMEHGVDLQKAREEHTNIINERRGKNGLPEL